MRFFIGVVLLVISGFVNADVFDNFRSESDHVTKEIGCAKPKLITGNKDLAGLYGCIAGVGETVKLFINEKVGTGKVNNVKLMWNDWTKDLGDGLHTDQFLAKKWVSVVATMYAPKQVEEVVSTFFNSKNKKIESSTHIIEYTYYVGPAIDERLLTITSKQ
ncbi:hypothetical protein [Psychromonas antarctica]|uniref:hypothetical protein n=1 Tax=Psychromonas antarctica TaxID=67573 RepID=UPI001EE85CA5|nr:hypothetical protein [Psychromonas antarctica]MCG6202511.1 hypothetical protein [Psychromonas antarctica]